MSSALVRITLSCFLILTFAYVVKAQCTIPTNWQQHLYIMNPSRPAKEIAQMIQYRNTTRIEKASNKRSTCQASSITPGGGIMLLLKRQNDNYNYCNWGKLGQSSRVLFNKISVFSTTNAPSTVQACDAQHGITDHIVLALRESPRTQNYRNSTVPKGEYIFNLKYADLTPVCVGDPSTNLTVGDTSLNFSIEAATTCAGTPNAGYGNPLNVVLNVLEVATAAELEFPPGSGGLMIVETANNSMYALNFKETDAALTIFMETSGTEYTCRGYADEAAIDPKFGPLVITVYSKRCFQSPQLCQNGGTCKPGYKVNVCMCAPGFEGSTCDKIIDKCNPSPCLNNAGCTMDGTSVTCKCAAGYIGAKCQIKDLCTPGYCENGGKCTTFTDINGDGFPLCKCVDPYHGSTCKESDSCSAGSCLNGGICMGSLSDTSIYCKCPSGYYGSKCESLGGPCSGSPGPCANGGTCRTTGTGATIGYRCDCNPGYSGDNCQNTVGGTCTNDPCQNDGKCTAVGDGVYCECSIFYDGGFCEEYQDWFIILLVLLILSSVSMFILIIVCACFCCCGWRPGSNRTPYEAYADHKTSGFAGNVTAEPAPNTVLFNLEPQNPYMGYQVGQRN